jgi:hypothetical protein
MTDKSPLDMNSDELTAYLEEADRISRTHSWLYGTFDVTCTMCHVSKGDLRALRECKGPVPRGCF